MQYLVCVGVSALRLHESKIRSFAKINAILLYLFGGESVRRKAHGNKKRTHMWAILSVLAVIQKVALSMPHSRHPSQITIHPIYGSDSLWLGGNFSAPTFLLFRPIERVWAGRKATTLHLKRCQFEVIYKLHARCGGVCGRRETATAMQLIRKWDKIFCLRSSTSLLHRTLTTSRVINLRNSSTRS